MAPPAESFSIHIPAFSDRGQVFVSPDGRRARVVRHAGRAIAVAAIAWFVCLVAVTLGINPMPGLRLPGATFLHLGAPHSAVTADRVTSRSVDGSSQNALPGGSASSDPSRGSTLERNLQGRNGDVGHRTPLTTTTPSTPRGGQVAQPDTPNQTNRPGSSDNGGGFQPNAGSPATDPPAAPNPEQGTGTGSPGAPAQNPAGHDIPKPVATPGHSGSNPGNPNAGTLPGNSGNSNGKPGSTGS